MKYKQNISVKLLMVKFGPKYIYMLGNYIVDALFDCLVMRVLFMLFPHIAWLNLGLFAFDEGTITIDAWLLASRCWEILGCKCSPSVLMEVLTSSTGIWTTVAAFWSLKKKLTVHYQWWYKESSYVDALCYYQCWYMRSQY